MNPEFLINIIVRARNEIAGVLEKAAGDVDKLTSAQKRQSSSAKDVDAATIKNRQSIAQLQKQYAEFTKGVAEGNKSTEDATYSLQRFSSEFQKAARAAPPGSALSEQMNQAAKAAQNLAKQIENTQKAQQRQVDDAHRQTAEMDASYQQLAKSRETTDRAAADASVKAEQDATEKRKALVLDVLNSVRDEDAERERLDRALSDASIKEDARVESARSASRVAREAADRAAADASVKAEQQAADKRSSFVMSLLDSVRKADAEREALDKSLSDFEIKDAARVESMRTSSRIDRDAQSFHHLAQAEEEADKSSRGLLGSLSSLFSVDDSKMTKLEGSINDVENTLDAGAFSAVRFAGNLRGLVIVGVFVFFQELVGAVVALGGALISVASAAVQAGAAVGGALAAGAAQALPVIGLLGAAWGRVGAVFQAVQQHIKDQTQAAYDNAQAAKTQQTAADGIRSAEEALASAHERAAQAQDALNKARADAVRGIQDLVSAERKAELQAESSALAQSDAQAAFGEAVQQGSVGDLASKALAVRQAAESRTDAGVSLSRARADAGTAVAAGVEGYPEVVQAKQAVSDAAKGIDDATRSLKEARQNAADTVSQISSGARLLDQMLARLSPAERRLYDALGALEKKYRDVFIGDGQKSGILGSIIDAFTFGAQRATALLGDPKIVEAAHKLSQTIGDQLKRVFDFLSSKKSVDFITDMASEARKNLPTVVSILEHIVTLFENIARAGSPALSAFLTDLDTLITKGATATGSKSGLKKLTDFFSKGEEYAKSFGKLGIAIGGLFLALIGSSAQKGAGVIDSITDAIKTATDYINTHQKDIKQFFDDAISASGAIASALGTLAVDVFKLFSSDRVKTFARAFQDTLLPALSNVATSIGKLTILALKFAGNSHTSALFQWLLVWGLLQKALLPLVVGLTRFGRGLSLILGSASGVGFFNTLLTFATKFGPAMVAVGAAVIILNGHLPRLNDLLKILSGFLSVIIIKTLAPGAVKTAFAAFATGLDLIADSAMLGKLGKLGTFFSDMLTNVSSLIKKLPFLKDEVAGVNAAGEGNVARTAGGVILPPGVRSVPIEPGVASAAGGVERGVIGGAATGAGAAKAASIGAADLAVPVALVVALLSYVTANGSILDKLQKVASNFTLGLIPGPKDNSGQQQKSALTQAQANVAQGAFEQVIKRAEKGYPLAGTGGGVQVLPTKPLTTSGISKDFDVSIANAGKNVLPTSQIASQQFDLATTLGLSLTEFDKLSKGDLTALKKQFDGARGTIDKITDNLSRFKTSLSQINVKDVIDPNSIAQFLSNIGRLNKNGVSSITNLRETFQNNLDLIGKGFTEGSVDWQRAMTQNFGAGINALKKSMADGQISTASGMKEISRIVKQEMTFVRDNISTLSADAKDRIAKNFGAARVAIEDQTGGWYDATGKALKKIRDLMTQELQLYGLTPSQARTIARNNNGGKNGEFGAVAGGGNEGGAAQITNPSLPGAATGGRVSGWVGRMGERGADAVHAVLGRGEAVLNWGHQKIVDPAMKAMYGFGLDGMFDRTRSFHGPQAADGMSTGGSVGLSLAGLKPGVTSVAQKVLSKFPLTVTSTSGGTHAKNSYHYLHEALDLGGTADTMKAAADWIKTSGLYKSLVEGIHNPNLSISKGKGVDPSFWGASTWAEHANHIHLAVAGAMGSMVSGLSKSLSATVKRVKVKGPNGDGGTFGAIAQGAANMARTAANHVLARASSAYGPSAGESDVAVGKGALTKAQAVGDIRRAEVLAGVPAGLRARWTSMALARAIQESGLDPNNVNTWDSNAAAGDPSVGLFQTIGATFRSFMLKGYGNIRNPLDNAIAAFRYMRSNYGHGDWGDALSTMIGRAGQPYARGGVIEGIKGQAVPILAHAREWVVNEGQQGRIAQMAGRSVGAVRAALGFSGSNAGAAGGTAVKPAKTSPYTIPDSLNVNDPFAINRELEKANKILDKLKLSIVTSKFTDALSNTYKAITDPTSGLFATLDTAIGVYSNKLATQLAGATYAVNKSGVVIQKLDPAQIAKRTITNLQLVYSRLVGAQTEIQQQLDAVQKQLKQKGLSAAQKELLTTVQTSLKSSLETINGEIASNLQDTFQAVEDRVTAMTDAAQKTETNATFTSGIQQRLRAVFGTTASAALGLPSSEQAAQVQAAALNAQAAAVQKAADYAKSQGHGDTYDALIQQIQDLRTSALEAVQQGLEADISAINDQASKAQARVDVSNRAADLLATMGDVPGSFALKGRNLQTTGGILTSQRDQLVGELGAAQAAGQSGVVEELIDQINDLNESIAENVTAVRDNTAAANQAATDATTARSGFLTSVYSGLGGILGTLGSISGVTDTAGQKKLLADQNGALSAALNGPGGLADQLLASIGVDLHGKSAGDVVSLLQNLDLNGIESTMDPAEKAAFEDLISSIISNTSSTADNTKSIDDLNQQTDAQSFASTAWTMFRTAIFNGANGLLPQYQQFAVPSAAVGAYLRSDGLIMGHAGETVVPAKVSAYQGSGGDTINLNLESPVEVFDPVNAAQQFAFARKVLGRSG